MQPQTGSGLVRIAVEVVEPTGIEARRAADDAVDVITLGQQELAMIL